VRAAELVPGGNRPTLTRFAQVTLPTGAVVDGEVVDVDTVAGAIKRLWAEGGFKSKQVIVGVASQRVIVRQAELAAMAEADLRSALRFEAQDLIPIPIDDAELDFSVLDARIEHGTDEPTMRILLAAAQSEVVNAHLAAVGAAGLSASVVDVAPLALLRAFPESPSASEAIIAVGAGLTNVVVRESGVPRFVRVLSVGGGDVTAAIARELACDLEYAEHLKRTAAPGRASLAGGSTATMVRTSTLVADKVTPLVEEIRGSLDFYLAQSDVERIDRIIVTGGGVLTPGLLDRLHDALGQEVEAGDPLESLAVGKTGLSPEDLRRAAPLMAAPVGLALAGVPVKAGRELCPLRINLLPAGVVAARKQRRQSAAAALAVVAFTASLGGTWAMRNQQVTKAEHQATAVEVNVASLQTQLNKLSDVTKLQADLKARQQSVLAALNNDVDFVRLVQQITASMPADVWLTSFTAQRTATGEPGTVTFSASGLSEDAVVQWVRQVGTNPSLTGLWVSATAKTSDPANQLVTFQSKATITPAARSDRAAQITGVKP
jgi:type IV pilus assembly protein PilM